MKEKDIFLSCCGNDELGNNKSTVAIKLSKINLNTDEEEIKDEVMLDNPIVNIIRNPRFTMVDLTFTDKEDYEFINLVARLQDFSKVENSAESDDGTIGPTTVLTIIPKEHGGKYYCAGMHAVWVVMPSVIGGPMDTLRFIFDNELFAAYSNPAIEENAEKLWNEGLEEE